MSHQPETKPLSEKDLCEIATDTVMRLPFMFAIVSIPDCRFIFLNDYTLGFLRQVGLDNPRDAIGMYAGDVLVNWEKATRPMVQRAVDTGQVQQLRDTPFEWMGYTTYWDLALVPHFDEHEQVHRISIMGIDTTERNQALNALRQNEEKFRTIFDNAGDAIFILDMDGHILDVNRVAADKLGRTREELQHMCVAEVDTPEYASLGLERVEEMQREGFSIFETAHRRKDGSVVPVEVNIRAIDYEGHPAVLAIARDITRRKQDEEELRMARDAAERESRRVAALESVSLAGITATGTCELLNALVDRIAKTLESDFCIIMLLDGQTGEFEAVASHELPEEVGFRVKQGEGVAGHIATEQRTMYIEDAEHDPRVISPYLKRAGVRSLLGTPLFTRGRVAGVVFVGTREPREFSIEESRLLEIVAARAAEAIDNAKLYDELVQSREDMAETLAREKHFSHLLQQALLPPTPTLGHGYDTADCFVPAFASRDVGGDFYDLFMTEDGKAGLLIGDVSGKGIEAASFAAATRSTVRAFAYKGSSASRAVTDTNAVLLGQQTDSDFAPFVTVFMAMLEPATGHMRYATAGHPPPAIYRDASGTVEFLSFGNPPVGLLEGYDYAEYECRLEPGDKIILYTDGLIEARSVSGVFGTEGLQEVLEEHGHLSPEDIMVRLLETAKDWARGHLPDDTAIIVVEREDVKGEKGEREKG